MEQLDYNLLFRWFVGLSVDEEAWDLSAFLEGRDRLVKTHIVERFMGSICRQAQLTSLLSGEHFMADWTITETWVSQCTLPTGSSKPEGPSTAVV